MSLMESRLDRVQLIVDMARAGNTVTEVTGNGGQMPGDYFHYQY
jgi:hypothetical protein